MERIKVEKRYQEFLNVLEKNHISATRRREMGDDIQGACGQLRKKRMEEQYRRVPY